MRIQGGTTGILAALLSGRLDDTDGRLEVERQRSAELTSGADKRERTMRAKRRAKRLARLHRFAARLGL